MHIYREKTIWGKERMLTDVISPLHTVSSHLGGVALAKGFSTFVASIHFFSV